MPSEGGGVARFIATQPAAQTFHTAAWSQTILDEVGGEAFQVVAYFGDAVAGWMPLYLRDGPAGFIANSAPYFGSHGGIIATGVASFTSVANAALEFLRNREVRSLNVIEPLCDPYRGLYEETLPVVTGTKRVAHVKVLTGLESPQALLASLGGLVRSNLRRKCWKAGLSVSREESDDAVDWLTLHHTAQMRSKGAPPKARSFFDAWRGRSDTDGKPASRLYIARHDGKPVAGLYLRTWRNWVEYLTPAFDIDAGHLQPLTAVIFEAMLDCARDGFRSWNFGGSGVDLWGVHAFKENWGGERVEYRYHLVDLGGVEAVRAHVEAQGTTHYPGYYLYPMG